MVTYRLAEVDLVEGGAVVEKSAADEVNFFEGRHAAVDRDKITGALSELGMQMFDTGGLGASAQFGENGDAWLRDPQAGRLESGRGELNGRRAVGNVFSASQRMIGLG
jgi:hypothetical protein